MPTDHDALVYTLENYRVVKSYIVTLDSLPEPTLQNAYQVFKHARDKFKLVGKGFIILLAGKTFYIAKAAQSKKGNLNYNIYALGEEQPEVAIHD